VNHCSHCRQPKSEAELKLCSRCRNVVYCSLKCQVESWNENHGSVCRLKPNLEDEIPLEARDKPWTHKLLCVRNFLRDKCRVDSKHWKQLASDVDLVTELYDQISTHESKCRLKQSEIAFATSATSSASLTRSRLTSCLAAKSVAKQQLPPSAARALKDVCDAGRLLPSCASLPHPPHPSALGEAVLSVQTKSNDFLLKTRQIVHQNLLLKQQVHAATKALSNLPDDSGVAEKAKMIKSSQSTISQMEKKGRDYEKRIHDLTKDLKRARFKEELTHDRIVADAEAMAEKEETTKELMEGVAAYHGLPADLSLAKVALAEKKRYLSELEVMSEGVMAGGAR